jgi:hypothetical protein
VPSLYLPLEAHGILRRRHQPPKTTTTTSTPTHALRTLTRLAISPPRPPHPFGARWLTFVVPLNGIVACRRQHLPPHMALSPPPISTSRIPSNFSLSLATASRTLMASTVPKHNGQSATLPRTLYLVPALTNLTGAGTGRVVWWHLSLSLMYMYLFKCFMSRCSCTVLMYCTVRS